MQKTRLAKLSVLIVVYFICLFPLGRCFADCTACTESHKLRVVLKNGKSIIGYIGWNSSANQQYYEMISQLASDAVTKIRKDTFEGHVAKERAERFKDCIRRYSASSEFELWLALETINIQTTYGKPYNADKWTFVLFRNFQALPGGRYAIDVKDFIEIDYKDISKLEYVKQDLKINTTSLPPFLTSKQIEMVRSKKPHFHVYADNSMASMDLFCYDPNMTFEEFVDVLACTGAGSYGSGFEVRLGPVRGNYKVPVKERDCSEWEKSQGKYGYDRDAYFRKYNCVEFVNGYD